MLEEGRDIFPSRVSILDHLSQTGFLFLFKFGKLPTSSAGAKHDLPLLLDSYSHRTLAEMVSLQCEVINETSVNLQHYSDLNTIIVICSRHLLDTVPSSFVEAMEHRTYGN